MSPLQDRITSMVHAFVDQERKDAVRALARDVGAMEARVAELEARCKRLEELGAELRVCAGYLGWACSDDSDCITMAERACEAWDKEAKP